MTAPADGPAGSAMCGAPPTGPSQKIPTTSVDATFPTPATYFARRSPPVFIQHCALLRIASKFLSRFCKSARERNLTLAGPCLLIEILPSEFQQMKCQIRLKASCQCSPGKT